MAYKGDDLDLRSPQSPSPGGFGQGGGLGQGEPGQSGLGQGGPAQASPGHAGFTGFTGYGVDGEAPASPNGARQRGRVGQSGGNGQYTNGTQSRSPAMYVDETLLACCNHAYDIASANGAREVMLEHLVHALTRVPEAAQILESRGVHVMALRRESATVIANDLPISPSHSGAAVRASSDFDAVLHLAAANARLRADQPTGVRDVLFVLMNYDRQASGIELLRRHWASWSETDPSDRDDPVRAAPTRPSVAVPPQLPRELQREARAETRAQAYQPVADRTVPPPQPRADRQAETRLEALVNSLHESVQSQRAETQALRAAIGARLLRLEKAVEQGRLDNGTMAMEAALTTRLQRLEKMQESLLAQRVSLAPLEAGMNERFHRLEKVLEAGMSERLHRLEKTLETARLDQSRVPAGLHERLQTMERSIEGRLAEMQRVWGQSGGQFNNQVAERLLRLEKSVEGVTNAMPEGLVDRMQSMERSFEGKITEGMRTWGSIGERLQGLERSLTAHRAEVAHLQTTSAQVQTLLNERGQAMDRAIEGWRQDSAAAATRVPGPLLERLGALESTLAAWRDQSMTLASTGEGGGEVSAVLFERLQALEQSIAATRDDAVRAARASEGAIAELRSGVTRLSGVQQNLAAAIDQWRHDNTGDLGQISNRLESIEQGSVRPMELLESLNSRIQAMGMTMTAGGMQTQPTATAGGAMQTSTRAVGAGNGQRRGFWRWLFGLG